MSFAASFLKLSRLDGWVNRVTGLGTEDDKTNHTSFESEGRLNDATLDALYDEDDMASRICDAPAEHMMRRPFEVVVEGDAGLGPAVVEYLEGLESLQRITDALVWERVFGGAVVAVGADDGEDVAEPLREDSIESLRFLNTLDRRDVVSQYWYSDPHEKHYGRPSVYRLTYVVNGIEAPRVGVPQQWKPHTMLVHESRLLTFRGARTSVRNRQKWNGWGASLLSRVRKPLQRYNDNWASVSHIMADCSQGVYKLKGLVDAIGSGKEHLLETRFRMVDRGRSVMRAIMVDAEGEDFMRRDTTMSGLPDLIDRSSTRLAAAGRMPVTVLMGISPAGLNATGESDVRNWYDSIESERTQKVLPQIRRLVRLAFLAKDGPTGGVVPEKWEVRFPSLWQETEKEKADTSAAKTTSDVQLIQAGVLTPEEVAIRRAEEFDIDTDEREAALESYKLKLSDGDTDLTPGGESTAAEKPAPVEEKPAEQAAPATTEDAPPVDATTTPKDSLTGVQITSLLDVLDAISNRRIPREVGVNVVSVAFALSTEEADKLVGSVGKTFFAPDAPAEVAPQGAPAGDGEQPPPTDETPAVEPSEAADG